MDRTTGCSEIGLLHRREFLEQARVFKRIQLHRHGIPRSILCDREFSKGEFALLFQILDIDLTPVPAHSHKSNGAIERANQAVRSYYNRLRINDQRVPTEELAQEAVYGKIINLRQNLASSFELLYRRSPLLSGKQPISTSRLTAVS